MNRENAFLVEARAGNSDPIAFDLVRLEPIALGTLDVPVFQNDCGIAIGPYAGIYDQGECSIAVGHSAGRTFQGHYAVAIGTRAGSQDQSEDGVAIGRDAGSVNQGASAIAIGTFAGQTNQPDHTIVLNATGAPLTGTTQSSAFYAAPVRASDASRLLLYDPTSAEIVHASKNNVLPNGSTYSNYLFWNSSIAEWNIGSREVHLGGEAGRTNQGAGAVAVGQYAGQLNQGAAAIAIGQYAGQTNQPANSIVLNASGAALGGATQAGALYVAPVRTGAASRVLYYDPLSKEVVHDAKPDSVPPGTTYSDYLFWNANSATWDIGSNTVHLGAGAAQTNQGAGAVAVGQTAGQTNQGVNAVAMGLQAGQFGQKGGAVALGAQAGQTNQGTASIAIGLFAGQTNQPDNSIVLNASGAALGGATQASALYVAPIRTVTGSGSVWYSNNVIAAGVQYSDYLFWNPTLGKWDVGTSEVHLGRLAGQTAQQSGAVALGAQAGQVNQFTSAVAIGQFAGQSFQGEASVAIGNSAGAATQAGDGLITLAFVSSVARSSNVATIVTTNVHNLLVNQIVSVQVATNTSFNATNVTITGVTPTSFTYNNTGSVLSTTADTGSVYASGSNAVAIGTSAGNNLQGPNSIAIGHQAGSQFQSGWTTLSGSISTVARSTNVATIVTAAAHRLVTGQTVRVVCSSNSTFDVYNVAANVANATTFTYANSGTNVTTVAGTGSVFVRGLNSVALGTFAGNTNQGGNAVAVGSNAGQTDQGGNAVAVGNSAGQNIQGANAVAIGNFAALNAQGASAVAVGDNAGQTGQGAGAVGIGVQAGFWRQGANAVALGYGAGTSFQSSEAIAIGLNAGRTGQGVNAIAIGSLAGRDNQPSNSIILNATGTVLANTTLSSALYVAPVKDARFTTGGNGSGGVVMGYNILTKELSSVSYRTYFVNRNYTASSNNTLTYQTVRFNTGMASMFARISLQLGYPDYDGRNGVQWVGTVAYQQFYGAAYAGSNALINTQIQQNGNGRITWAATPPVFWQDAGGNTPELIWDYTITVPGGEGPGTIYMTCWVELMSAAGNAAYPVRAGDYLGWVDFVSVI